MGFKKMRARFRRKLRRVARKIRRRRIRRRKLRRIKSAGRFYSTAKKLHPKNKVPRGGYSL